MRNKTADRIILKSALPRCLAVYEHASSYITPRFFSTIAPSTPHNNWEDYKRQECTMNVAALSTCAPSQEIDIATFYTTGSCIAIFQFVFITSLVIVF